MISEAKKALMVLLILLVGVAGNVKAQDPAPDQKVLKMILAEQYDKARKEIDTRMKMDSKNPENYFLEGTYQFSLEEYDKAKDAFIEGVKTRSKYIYNHVGLALVYNEEGLKEERNNSLEQAEKLNKKEDIDVLLALALAYISAKEETKDAKDTWLKKAEIVLYRVREDAPNDPRGWMRLGDYYQEKGIDELAKVNYEKTIEIDPDFIRGYLRLGQIEIREKNWNEGLRYLNTAIQKDPTLAPPYKERGELYLKAGEYEKAKEDYKKYVSLLPDDVRSKLRYGSFLYLTKNYQEAIDQLNSVDTTTLVKQRLLGYCYAELGEMDKAKEAMDQYFVMIGGEDSEKVLAEDFEAKGKVFLKGGEDDKAVQYFEKMFLKASMNGTLESKYGTPEGYYEDLAKQFREEKNYSREAFYRAQVINAKSAVSLNDYFNLGFAQFRAEEYEKAEETFRKVIEVKDDWEGGWYWLGSTLYKKTPDSKDWPASEPWMKVYDLMKDTPIDDLSRTEKSHMETVAAYLAFYKFNPDQPEEPTPDDLHCDDAQPFVEKVLEVNPENTQVKQITNYCDEVRRVQGGK